MVKHSPMMFSVSFPRTAGHLFDGCPCYYSSESTENLSAPAVPADNYMNSFVSPFDPAPAEVRILTEGTRPGHFFNREATRRDYPLCHVSRIARTSVEFCFLHSCCSSRPAPDGPAPMNWSESLLRVSG